MHRLTRILSVLLITAFCLAGVPKAIARNSFLVSLSRTDRILTAEGGIREKLTSQNNQKSPFEKLLDIFRRTSKRGGSRGEFCSVSPNLVSRKIWNTHPLFVWQGTVTKIEVKLRGNESPIWSHNLTQKEQIAQSILYSGSALEPGQTYDYLVTYETEDKGQTILDTAQPIRFEVMEAQERDRLEEELAALENHNSTMSDEERTQQRALYFAEQELFLDAVRELFSMSNPSLKWTNEIQQLRTEFCK